MNNTALGAENKKEQTINFISEAHEKFYYEKLKEVRYQDVYHKALCYCLGISDDTRRNVDSIYDFKTGCVKTELVLCQDLVQVKMRNFSHFNPPEAQPQCVFFHTIVRIHLVTYSYNGYEFVSYCRKLPDIRKSSGMPACNREF